jgi:hypothetical protein
VDVKAVVSKSVAFEALAEAVADQSAEPEKYLKIISVF